jgi:hypothetical protein
MIFLDLRPSMLDDLGLERLALFSNRQANLAGLRRF